MKYNSYSKNKKILWAISIKYFNIDILFPEPI